MSSALKLLNGLHSYVNKRKLLYAAVTTIGVATVGLKTLNCEEIQKPDANNGKKVVDQQKFKRKRILQHFGKDTVELLSQAENKIPSEAKILPSSYEEERGPLLRNGDLNWACTCIEHEVVGPCNVQFREFRQFIHDHGTDMDYDDNEELQLKMFEIVKTFLDCNKKYPLYYPPRNYSHDDDDDDEVDESMKQTTPDGSKDGKDSEGSVQKVGEDTKEKIKAQATDVIFDTVR